MLIFSTSLALEKAREDAAYRYDRSCRHPCSTLPLVSQTWFLHIAPVMWMQDVGCIYQNWSSTYGLRSTMLMGKGTILLLLGRPWQLRKHWQYEMLASIPLVYWKAQSVAVGLGLDWGILNRGKLHRSCNYVFCLIYPTTSLVLIWLGCSPWQALMAWMSMTHIRWSRTCR